MNPTQRSASGFRSLVYLVNLLVVFSVCALCAQADQTDQTDQIQPDQIQPDQIQPDQADQAPPQPRPQLRPRRRAQNPTLDDAPAEKPETKKPASPGSTPWSIELMGGGIAGAASNYTITTPTTTTTSTDATNTSLFLGGEIDYDIIPNIALGVAGEWSRYSYQNTLITSDSEITGLFIPRVQAGVDDFLFWGGVGVGATVTSIGTTSSNGVSPIILGTSSSTVGFTVSPRAGVDYKVDDQFFLGALGAYVNTRGSLSTAATPTVIGGTSVTTQTTETFTRSWLEFGVRIGMHF